MRASTNLRTSLALVLSALAGLGYAFYNHFPLTYTDSGMYIASGGSLFVPFDRPLAYGLFIRESSLGISLWLTVAAQSLIASWLVYELIKRIVPRYPRPLLVGLFLLLACTTGLSLTVSMVSPDIFAPLVTIVLLLVLLPGASGGKRIVMMLLLVIFNLFHMSNTLLSLGLGTLALVVSLLFPLRSQIDRRWLSVALAVSLASPLLMATINWSVDGRFRTIDATHVFLAASLAEKGVLQAYLDKACKNKPDEYALCRYRNAIPANATRFIWGKHSIVRETNGWRDPQGEYPRVLRHILLQPRFLGMAIVQSIKATVAQFFDFDLEGYGYPTPATSDTAEVHNYYQHEFPDFVAARQYRHKLDYVLVSRIQAPLVYAAMLVWLGLLLFRMRLQLSDAQVFILLYTMAALWVNAAVTGTFSSVVDRYQSRIAWLLVAVVAATLFALWRTTSGQRIRVD